MFVCAIATCMMAVARMAVAADKPSKPQIVMGLVIDAERKNPKELKSITVKQDGEETPVKYVVDPDLNPRSATALTGIFAVGRVRLTYKLDGDTRHLTNIEKITGRASGTVVGQVVETHGWR